MYSAMHIGKDQLPARLGGHRSNKSIVMPAQHHYDIGGHNEQ